MRKRAIFRFTGSLLVSLMLVAFQGWLNCESAAEDIGKKPYNIEIYSFMPGSGTYVIGAALADLINKNSTWLKATAVSSRGTTTNTKMLLTEPDKRSKSIVWANFSDHFLAQAGRLPGMPGKRYTTMRVVTLIGLIGNGPVTLDPKIKNIRDFAGKRYAVGPKGVWGMDKKFRSIFEAAGVADKIKFENMNFGKAKDALRDGLIDGTNGGCFYTGNNKWAGNPALEELLLTTDIHFVQWDKEDIEKAAKALDVPQDLVFSQYVIPPGGLGPKQKEPFSVNKAYMLWSADIALPDEVTYEICRVVYEHSDEFGKYHISGKAISRETMSKSESSDPKWVHPGALKFYREKNLKLGEIDLK